MPSPSPFSTPPSFRTSLETMTADEVYLTGGTIDGVAIGGTTPAAGNFSSLAINGTPVSGGGGGGTPGGSSGDIQTNSSGNFGAITPATGVSTWLATPSSANLRTVLTDETGTGVAVFATSPTLVTPILGTPTSVNLSNATVVPMAQANGILPAANGGAGTVSGLMKANGSGAVSVATAGTDYAGVATANTFTAGQATTPVTGGTVTGTVTPDASAANDWTYTLGATGMTMANPTNLRAGQTVNLFLTQDGTGSRTITTWGSAYRFAGGTEPTLTTTAGALDMVSCRAVSSTVLVCGVALDVK